MATVYAAEDLKHHRRVAIKVLHPELSEAVGADRFLREIEIAARLTHPHVLPLHDSGEADGLLWYVMPFVEGESLRARMERERQMPIDDTVRLLEEIASALAHAHERGIIHRDIKPENILLDRRGHACVADFGLARALTSVTSTRLTAPGLTVGSPAYMSPEQARAQGEVDHRTDLWALAFRLPAAAESEAEIVPAIGDRVRFSGMLKSGAARQNGGDRQAMMATMQKIRGHADEAFEKEIKPVLSAEQITKAAIFMRLTLMPARRAASALPPTA